MGGRRKAFKVLKKVKPEKLKSLFDCGSCGFKNCIIIKMYVYLNHILQK